MLFCHYRTQHYSTKQSATSVERHSTLAHQVTLPVRVNLRNWNYTNYSSLQTNKSLSILILSYRPPPNATKTKILRTTIINIQTQRNDTDVEEAEPKIDDEPLCKKTEFPNDGLPEISGATNRLMHRYIRKAPKGIQRNT